ncbi:tetratricopeptide repeat protein [Paenibacillus pini]|uniref:Tetratrico peptide repeat group 5 domain-containing protein n=1 Tax=Paenibacillus pini JCM 16418 TaxID=1236976 RepID=W7YHC6_9BACL|nr:tetratricopeptide repeat protein [Paenibacillus pini]GAF07862.1 hypothetical protein JCM16418_1894 [Paenibacillus pini JCM 16418]
MCETIEIAVRLREDGELEKARTLLLAFGEQQPENAYVQYQTAWAHDALGLEWEAVPFYERAIQLGLDSEDLAGAMLGLGSTYRVIGQYIQSKQILERAILTFPERQEFKVFLAMALHNLGEHAEAMNLLLKSLADTSSDVGIRRYEKAIHFYADKLEQTW